MISSAPVLVAGSQVFHGRDQADTRLTATALTRCTGKNLGADDSAALRLRAEAGTTLPAKVPDFLGLGDRHPLGNHLGCFATVDGNLLFFISGHFLVSGQ